MTDTSLQAALARVERALARVEQAAHAGIAAHALGDEALAVLEARHDRLRARVMDTIAQLDRLIATEDAR